MAVTCYRCDRTFHTRSSLDQHVRDSSSHHECPECNFDGSTWDELLSHLRRAGCRTVCQGCNNGKGSHWPNNSKAYSNHLRDCNVCPDCERHFQTPANLAGHELTHRSADYECLGCYRMFRTYGGMIIHLESGSCESQLDIIDLNETAAQCYQWAYYINNQYRDDMLDRNDLDEEFSDKPYPYYCPTCHVDFPKLSSLFQHVESPSCSQELEDGAIIRIRSRRKFRVSESVL